VSGVEASRKGDTTAVHAPFPKAIGQGEKLYFILAVLQIAGGPRAVATTMKWRDKKNSHHLRPIKNIIKMNQM